MHEWLLRTSYSSLKVVVFLHVHIQNKTLRKNYFQKTLRIHRKIIYCECKFSNDFMHMIFKYIIQKKCESLHNKYFLSLALSMYEMIGLREQGRILGETKF
jgi:hypothetical protein